MIFHDPHANLGESGDYWRGYAAAENVVRGEYERYTFKRESSALALGLAFGAAIGVVLTGLLLGWFS